jgi:uncharacterized membrane protein
MMIGSTEIILFFSLFMYLILPIVVIYLICNYLINKKRASCEGKSALDFAKERYAKDEITKEEFEEIKKNLID